jgi:hypothetical protein
MIAQGGSRPPSPAGVPSGDSAAGAPGAGSSSDSYGSNNGGSGGHNTNTGGHGSGYNNNRSRRDRDCGRGKGNPGSHINFTTGSNQGSRPTFPNTLWTSGYNPWQGMVQAAPLRTFQFTYNESAEHTCHACQLGKHVRLPFSSSSSFSYFPFQLLHSDVWTSPVPSISGYKFYLVIIDDYSHYVWTFPLLQKSDVVPTFLSFYSYVTRQFCLPILALQTDNG